MPNSQTSSPESEPAAAPVAGFGLGFAGSPAQIAALIAALVAARAEMTSPVKESTNPHFQHRYANLGSVLEATVPSLCKNGLFCTQLTRISANGINLLVTILAHKDGGQLTGEYNMGANPDPQKMGSALTYARRYTLKALLALEAEDDDAEVASAPPTVKAAPRRAPEGAARPQPRQQEPASPKLMARILLACQTIHAHEDDWESVGHVLEHYSEYQGQGIRDFTVLSKRGGRAAVTYKGLKARAIEIVGSTDDWDEIVAKTELG